MASLAWSFLMLLVVLAAVPASLWVMKRLQTLRPASAPRAMAVIAQLPLGPRERLVTVRVGDRTLVLGVTAQQVALVTELEEGLPGAEAPPPAPGTPPAAGAPFAAALRRLR